MKKLILIAFAAWALAGCGGDSTTTPMMDAGSDAQADAGSDSGVGSAGLQLVSVEWANDHLDDPNVQFIDSSSNSIFEANHIPGAINLTPSALAEQRDGISAQVATQPKAQDVFRAAGLRNDTVAVVYGRRPEYDPTRVVWVLEHYSHGEVRWMDGGFDAWLAQSLPTETGASSDSASTYTIPAINEDLRVTGTWVEEQLGPSPYDSSTIKLVDARSQGEFEAGRIPTAIHAEWSLNLDGGFMKTMAEVQARHPGLNTGDTVVTYCVTGWRASAAWAALRWLGYTDVRVYDGSWSEWGNGSFPVETE